jgi:hypothetical protein
MKSEVQILYKHSLHMLRYSCNAFYAKHIWSGYSWGFLTSVSAWHFKREDVATKKKLCLQLANCYSLSTDRIDNFN